MMITRTLSEMIIRTLSENRTEVIKILSKETQKGAVLSDENSKVTAIAKEIQEIYGKVQDFSLPKGFCIEEHPSRDVCIDELVNSAKEEHLKDFERQYHLAEGIASALEDMNLAVELYKHSVSTLRILQLASKGGQCDYVSAWYSLLLSCAQELQYGAMLWQESCHTGICDQLICKGGHCFVALGEIYRVAQILHFSLQCFKPWVLSDPGMLSKMLACLDSGTNAWTSGLERALKMVVDSDHSDASGTNVGTMGTQRQNSARTQTRTRSHLENPAIRTPEDFCAA